MFPKFLPSFTLATMLLATSSSTISALAIPTSLSTSSTPNSSLQPRAAGSTAAFILLAIAPSSSTCDNAPAPDECATNEQAAPFLVDAMVKYGISSPQEMAAVLSLIAFESGDFKFNINHFPGRPGQGTRAMFMPNFVLSYAQSIPALSTALAATDKSDLNGIRALVLPDEYSWASAVWFLTSQCASIRPQLQAGGEAGFEAYMGCVGTAATADRLAVWGRAKSAFGL